MTPQALTKLRQETIILCSLDLTYTIGTLSKLTGLSTHTIRAWERRYDALAPNRSGTNRRVYRTDDLERLGILQRVVDAGHSIGQVARLSTEQLRALDVQKSPVASPVSPFEQAEGDSNPFLVASQNAMLRLDPEALEDALIRGNASMGIFGLLNGVIVPLIGEIESRWVAGTLSISNEHMASAVLRSFLDQVRKSMPGSTSSPLLVVTTPQNQIHEIGALMVAIVAATQGWRVTYLGPNLPAEEIVKAVNQTSARAVALSLVYPTDDPLLSNEIRYLRQHLQPEVSLIVGGRAIESYRPVLVETDATVLTDLISAKEAFRNGIIGQS